MFHVFTDLDRTLFQSLPGQTPSLSTQVTNKLWITPEQKSLWALCHQAEMVVPVTARKPEQFYNGTLPWQKVFTSYKIASHGAEILLPDGRFDAVWMEHVFEGLRRVSETLEAILLIMERHVSNAPWMKVETYRISHEKNLVWLNLVVNNELVMKNQDDIMRCYDMSNLVDTPITPIEVAHQVARSIAMTGYNMLLDVDPDCRCFLLAPHFTIMPSAYSKKSAVAHVMKSLSHDAVTLGIGDATADWSFMSLCDFQMLPSQTQISLKVSEIIDS
ncbi:hypothetical protein AB6D11_00320 [Vibrio splendidus]